MEPTQEIINNAKQLYSLSWISSELKSALENDFPELNESEDERIRKELLKEIEFISPRDGETDGEGLILPSYHARIDRYKSYLEKQKEQKPKWSEENEKHLYNAIEAVKYTYDVSVGSSGAQCVEFLKSLRPQPHWKPSENKDVYEIAYERYPINNRLVREVTKDINEDTRDGFIDGYNYCNSTHWKPSKKQMEALEDAFRKDGGNEYRKVINSLYCDLQKLL